MKKVIAPIILITLVISAGVSCKKSSDTTVDETTMLMNKNWIVTGSIVSPAFNGITDMYAAQPACMKDDVYRFNPNNIEVFDEGPTKCYASDPQTITGTWSYNPNTKKLYFSEPDQATIDVTELNNSTLKGTAKDTSLGVIYTYSVTLSAQ